MKTTYSILLIFMVLLTYKGYSQTANEYRERGDAKYKLKDYIGAIADFTKYDQI